MGLGDTLGLAHTSGVSFLEQPSFSSSTPLTPQIAILAFGGGHKASGPEAASAMVGSGCPIPSLCKREWQRGLLPSPVSRGSDLLMSLVASHWPCPSPGFLGTGERE